MSTPTIDREAAGRFLKLLDRDAKDFTLQMVDDDKRAGHVKDNSLARVTSDRAEALKLYQRGAAVYVTINETDLTGRSSVNIQRVRSIWQEDDEGNDGPFPLEPSVVVESSPGHRHRYWLVADRWPADEQGRADFDAVMARMVESYGSDKGAKDIARVLRLPGFLHRKNPERPHLVRVVESSGRRYTRNEILHAFPPVERPRPPVEREKVVRTFEPCSHELGDCDERTVADALKYVLADDRDIWLRIAMALKAEFGERGRAIWDRWSSTSDKYVDADQSKTWDSLRRDGVTINTLFYYARQRGWMPSLSESERRVWRAAGIALRRWKPTPAWEAFSCWFRDQHVNEVVARTAFKTILEKEARHVR